MRARTRFWTIAGLAGVLIVWAIVIGSAVPVVGAAGVCGWLLAQQYRFIKLTETTLADITVEQTVSQSRVATDDQTLVTISVDADDPLPVTVRVTPVVPPGGETDGKPFTMARGSDEETRSIAVTWPIAGEFTLERPRITLTDRLELFEQTVGVGPEQTVSVEPRKPRNMHVGEGGEPLTVGVGEHEGSQIGTGLEPAEIREYLPGDTPRAIDWKATARLDGTYVREFETETDRETILIVDHRGSMGTGNPGERKIEYLRQVALAFVERANESSDPLGCYMVDEGGLHNVFEPSADSVHQERIRRRLQAIEPSDEPSPQNGSVDHGESSPRQARRVTERLSGDSEFARRLRPYFDRPEAYVDQAMSAPLVAAVKTVRARRSGAFWTVILTDDERKAEVRETVKLTRQREGGVLVFLAPTVLYEPGGLSDLDAAYDQYVEFEEFRRSLASMTGVSAFEVGPADRVATVLNTAQTRQTQDREEWQ